MASKTSQSNELDVDALVNELEQKLDRLRVIY